MTTILFSPPPPAGTPVQVLWARLSSKTEPGDIWMDGEFIRSIGAGPGLQYMVTCATPRSAPHRITVPVAPESVRMVAQR